MNYSATKNHKQEESKKAKDQKEETDYEESERGQRSTPHAEFHQYLRNNLS